MANNLANQSCRELPKGSAALSHQEVEQRLPEVPGWSSQGSEIQKVFSFNSYYETMAFVNAIAAISHAQNHHPDLEVGYNKCVVKYSTHSVGGLSDNDFICAAKIEALLKLI